jgi:hypothetical protein
VWRGFVRRSSSSPRSSWSRAAWRWLRTDSDDRGAFKCWRGKPTPRSRLARRQWGSSLFHYPGHMHCSMRLVGSKDRGRTSIDRRQS